MVFESLSSQANIHSFLESDDRIGLVMKFMDDALTELDNLDGLVSSYKIHLNVSSYLTPLTNHLLIKRKGR